MAYKVKEVKYTNEEGSESLATLKGDGVFTFSMPNCDTNVSAGVYPVYSVETIQLKGGIVTSDKNVAFEGDTVALDIMPASGYSVSAIDILTDDDTPTGIVTTGNKFTMPNYNVKVRVKFNTGRYWIIANNEEGCNTNGSVKFYVGANEVATAAEGATVKIVGSSDADCVFFDGATVNRTDDGTDVMVNISEDGGMSFEMPSSDVTVCALFDVDDTTRNAATIEISQSRNNGRAGFDENLTIHAAQNLRACEEVSFYVLPDEGYTIETNVTSQQSSINTWSEEWGDGNRGLKYTFVMPNKPVAINVRFTDGSEDIKYDIVTSVQPQWCGVGLNASVETQSDGEPVSVEITRNGCKVLDGVVYYYNRFGQKNVIQDGIHDTDEQEAPDVSFTMPKADVFVDFVFECPEQRLICPTCEVTEPYSLDTGWIDSVETHQGSYSGDEITECLQSLPGHNVTLYPLDGENIAYIRVMEKAGTEGSATRLIPSSAERSAVDVLSWSFLMPCGDVTVCPIECNGAENRLLMFDHGVDEYIKVKVDGIDAQITNDAIMVESGKTVTITSIMDQYDNPLAYFIADRCKIEQMVDDTVVGYGYMSNADLYTISFDMPCTDAKLHIEFAVDDGSGGCPIFRYKINKATNIDLTEFRAYKCNTEETECNIEIGPSNCIPEQTHVAIVARTQCKKDTANGEHQFIEVFNGHQVGEISVSPNIEATLVEYEPQQGAEKYYKKWTFTMPAEDVSVSVSSMPFDYYVALWAVSTDGQPSQDGGHYDVPVYVLNEAEIPSRGCVRDVYKGNMGDVFRDPYHFGDEQGLWKESYDGRDDIIEGEESTDAIVFVMYEKNTEANVDMYHLVFRAARTLNTNDYVEPGKYILYSLTTNECYNMFGTFVMCLSCDGNEEEIDYGSFSLDTCEVNNTAHSGTPKIGDFYYFRMPQGQNVQVFTEFLSSPADC